MLLLLFFGTLGISLIASARVKSNYARYSQLAASSGLTGAQAAAEILRRAGIHDVEIRAQDGMLTDHYDPGHRRLVLSRDNYHGRSVAALGVSAHEAGHALQHARAYAPLQLRMAAVGVTSVASQIVTWLPLLGLFTGVIRPDACFAILALGWGVIMAFNLVTLPVEFDASARAKRLLLETGMVAPGAETDGVNRVLNAAAWTYVAAFLTSLAYFLWHVLPFLTGARDDD